MVKAVISETSSAPEHCHPFDRSEVMPRRGIGVAVEGICFSQSRENNRSLAPQNQTYLRPEPSSGGARMTVSGVARSGPDCRISKI